MAGEMFVLLGWAWDIAIVGAAVALLTLQSETPRTGRDLRASLAALLLGRPGDGPAVPRGPVSVFAVRAPVLRLSGYR